MALRITEFFGRPPLAPEAASDVRELRCPFIEGPCIKPEHGACSFAMVSQPDDAIIACPNRLYADNYRVLSDVADRAFQKPSRLIKAADIGRLVEGNALLGDEVAVFGRYWGQELPLKRPKGVNSKDMGSYYMDWILAKVDDRGQLSEFVAVEVQTIDTTGNYRDQSDAFFKSKGFVDAQGRNPGYSDAGMNWENVNKRILPQLIYKGHVLRREEKCHKGLFFVCPRQVLDRVKSRLSNRMQSYVPANSTITFLAYEPVPAAPVGEHRKLVVAEEFTTAVDEVARALTFPDNLPEMGAYETAIETVLQPTSRRY